MNKLILAGLLAAMAASIPPAAAQRGPSNGCGVCVTTAVTPPTAQEASDLAFMREEEKLARDIYQQLEAKWNLTVFRNIAASESQHFDAIGTLLTRYGVADPAAGKSPGVYSNAALGALYTELMAKANQSVADALTVGVAIELKDIADLEKAVAATAKLDIKRVYSNLMSASHSHLEAFQTTLEVTLP